MIIDVPLNGPLKSNSVFYDICNLLKSKICPTSIGGNSLFPKYYYKLRELINKLTTNESTSYDNCKVKAIKGSFFMIFLKHYLDKSDRSFFYLSNVKVLLTRLNNVSFYSLSPIESHSITSNTLEELVYKYECFVKSRQNGFDDNFFGNITFDIDTNPNVIYNIVDSLTFKNDFTTFTKCNDLDTLFHKIWSSVGFIPYHELITLNSNTTRSLYNNFFLPYISIDIEGDVYEYLKSDVMILPDEFKSTLFKNVEEYSDFSDYSDSNGSETLEHNFDFNLIEFKTFFSTVKNSILKLGGLVFPYINGSYLQDGVWMTRNTTVCRDLRDTILILKGSTSWQEGNHKKLKLYLFKDPNYNRYTQLRLYVYEGRLIIITQLFFNQVYDYLLKEREFIKLFNRILEFYDKIKPYLPNGIYNLVLDLYILYKPENIYLTNINSWNIDKENLFDWEDIYEYATSGKRLIHDKSIKVTYFANVAFAILLSSKLSRHKVNSFVPEDIEEISRITAL